MPIQTNSIQRDPAWAYAAHRHTSAYGDGGDVLGAPGETLTFDGNDIYAPNEFEVNSVNDISLTSNNGQVEVIANTRIQLTENVRVGSWGGAPNCAVGITSSVAGVPSLGILQNDEFEDAIRVVSKFGASPSLLSFKERGYANQPTLYGPVTEIQPLVIHGSLGGSLTIIQPASSAGAPGYLNLETTRPLGTGAGRIYLTNGSAQFELQNELDAGIWKPRVTLNNTALQVWGNASALQGFPALEVIQNIAAPAIPSRLAVFRQRDVDVPAIAIRNGIDTLDLLTFTEQVGLIVGDPALTIPTTLNGKLTVNYISGSSPLIDVSADGLTSAANIIRINNNVLGTSNNTSRIIGVNKSLNNSTGNITTFSGEGLRVTLQSNNTSTGRINNTTEGLDITIDHRATDGPNSQADYDGINVRTLNEVRTLASMVSTAQMIDAQHTDYSQVGTGQLRIDASDLAFFQYFGVHNGGTLLYNSGLHTIMRLRGRMQGAPTFNAGAQFYVEQIDLTLFGPAFASAVPDIRGLDIVLPASYNLATASGLAVAGAGRIAKMCTNNEAVYALGKELIEKSAGVVHAVFDPATDIIQFGNITNQVAFSVYGSLDMPGGGGNWLSPPIMTTAQRNAMIVGWGASQSGRMWFNTTTSQWEGWNGVGVSIIG